jgi:ubiquinone/menaquinone biosynthesis C-methylase UbiE
MDYDTTTMPAVYDAGRGYSRQTLALWLGAIEKAAGGRRRIEAILDLGCGTGRYSGPLAEHFGAAVSAVDPSEKMLAEARRKNAPGVTHLQGHGERLPLESASVDMVFMSMVFHHFADPRQVARECRRVLKPGGVVVLRAGSTDQIDGYPYVPFFPRTEQLIRGALSSVDEMTAPFRDAGFEPSAPEVVMSEVAESWPAYAEKVALRADSILVQLGEADFAAGLADLRAYAARQPPVQPVIEPVDLLAFRRGEGAPS